jgi:methionyl-tRNA formyltransferase
MRILLFLNRDIESNIALNLLLETLSRHDASVFLSDRVGSPKAKVKDLDDLQFFEQDLLNEFIFPLMDQPAHEFQNDYLTFKQMESQHGIVSMPLNNANDPESIEMIASLKPDVIISIRYGRIFKGNIISIPRHGVINLHAGILPKYRGVLATFRAMMSDEPEIGCTLHYITDATVDTGPMIGQARVPLDKERSLLWNIISLYPSGIEMVVQTLKSIELGLEINTTEQGGLEAAYYTFPTAEDFVRFREKGYKVFDRTEYMEVLRKYYGCKNADWPG